MKNVRAVAVLPLLFAMSLRGDTIELKTGERIDGAFKQATSAGAVIEVAGQPITIPLEKVKAIYFGAAPARSVTSSAPSGDAMDALRALRSVTEGGTTYRDYAPRVSDAKIKVDRYLALPKTDNMALRDAIEAAMRAYQLALQAWGASIANATLTKMLVGASIDEDPVISKCTEVAALIAQATAKTAAKDVRAALIGTFAGEGTLGKAVGQGPSALWTCAAAQIATADRLQSQPNNTP